MLRPSGGSRSTGRTAHIARPADRRSCRARSKTMPYRCREKECASAAFAAGRGVQGFQTTDPWQLKSRRSWHLAHRLREARARSPQKHVQGEAQDPERTGNCGRGYRGERPGDKRFGAGGPFRQRPDSAIVREHALPDEAAALRFLVSGLAILQLTVGAGGLGPPVRHRRASRTLPGEGSRRGSNPLWRHCELDEGDTRSVDLDRHPGRRQRHAAWFAWSETCVQQHIASFGTSTRGGILPRLHGRGRHRVAGGGC